MSVEIANLTQTLDITVCKELNDQFKEQISHASAEDRERYGRFFFCVNRRSRDSVH